MRRHGSNGGSGRLSLVWAAALGAAALPGFASAAVTATSAQAGPARPPESGAHELRPPRWGRWRSAPTSATQAAPTSAIVTRLTTDNAGRRHRPGARRRDRLRHPDRGPFCARRRGFQHRHAGCPEARLEARLRRTVGAPSVAPAPLRRRAGAGSHAGNGRLKSPCGDNRSWDQPEVSRGGTGVAGSRTS